MNTTIELVIDLPFLAREINDAHRQVQFHGKSMLMEAKRAGEALLEARKKFPSDKLFGQWRTTETSIGHKNTAAQYMAVARKAATAHHDVLKNFADMSIRQFLELGAHKPEAPTPPRAFTREDAERALKLHALATRGATEGEQAAASSKLASFAKEFGMTPEAAVAKAREFLPDQEKTEGEKARAEAARKCAAAEEEIAGLKAQLHRIEARREELFKDRRNRPKEELLDLLVAAELRLEGFGT